ncbi:DUF2442 domain-containing protein [Limnothrix sp. FACHB-1083]|uniref:DUF2442 domain-containing protein n=1 Tax=unclassified Limnothrix TaxID=2632864 RepID=UPI00167FF71D|nr:DUF2442 domain-containing protein [Limnothrix sp. FACHB-1083]MBD2191397.1 DUF2442 domain-containing protein [Limnothrix sp. FACHB-1088]
MNPRVHSVIPRSNYTLEIQFTNQEVRAYDCLSLLDFGVFQELRDEAYFRKVKVFNGTVTWPNEQDICPDTLYLDSIPVPITAQPLSA